jgi:hypothetical protein
VIRFAETKFFNINYDLTKLICNTEEWQEIKVINMNKKLQIFLNGQSAFSENYFGDSGDLGGFVIYFINTGSIDYVRLSDINGNIVYSNDFN